MQADRDAQEKREAGIRSKAEEDAARKFGAREHTGSGAYENQMSNMAPTQAGHRRGLEVYLRQLQETFPFDKSAAGTVLI